MVIIKQTLLKKIIMKVKNIIAASLIWVSSLNANPSFSRGEKISNALISTLNAPEPKDIKSINANNQSMHTSKMTTENLQETPFQLGKSMVKLNGTNMIWGNQYQTVYNKYNTYKEEDSTFIQKLDKGITYPLIYPDLKKYFPDTINELQDKIDLSKYDLSAPHLIFIMKLNNEKTALAYYENAHLKMATQVSLGTLHHKTPSGQYPLKHDAIYRRSKSYNRAPMPYSIHVVKGIFLHQWYSDGNNRSHGCIRVPWFYQQRLYNQLPKDKGITKQIIIHAPYTPTLK